MVELVGQVPQTVVLVDHALSRAFYKGAIGHIVISGDDNPEIFDDSPGDAPRAIEGEAPPEPDDQASAPADEVATTGGPEGAVEGEPSGETLAVSIPAGALDFRDVPADDYTSSSLGGYEPTTSEVTVGTTVTWTNNDSVAHTVTSQDGSIDSGFIEPGQSWSWTFANPMTFNYYCTPHPWMRGQLQVVE